MYSLCQACFDTHHLQKFSAIGPLGDLLSEGQPASQPAAGTITFCDLTCTFRLGGRYARGGIVLCAKGWGAQALHEQWAQHSTAQQMERQQERPGPVLTCNLVKGGRTWRQAPSDKRQTRAVPSSLAVTATRPSSDSTTLFRRPVCPDRTRRHLPLSMDHTLQAGNPGGHVGREGRARSAILDLVRNFRSAAQQWPCNDKARCHTRQRVVALSRTWRHGRAML